MAQSEQLTRILSLLKHYKKSDSGEGYLGLCPAHDDTKYSLSLKDGTHGVVVHCFVGCTYNEIRDALHLTSADFFYRKVERPVAEAPKATSGQSYIQYDYHDEHGKVAHIVRRYPDKTFSQFQPDGTPGLKGVRRVLYHLDRLQGKKSVIVAEGEKDVDRIRDDLKFPATCCAGGSDGWKPEYAQQLKDAGVLEAVVLRDNDTAGVKYADKVASTCHALGLKVKLVILPFGPVKEKHGEDISDWLDVGHTKEELVDLIQKTAVYAAPAAQQETLTTKQAPSTDGKPVVISNAREDMDSLHTETYQIVVALNQSTPQVFQRSVHLVRVRPDDDGRPLIESFADASFSGYLAHSIQWLAMVNGRLKPIHPPAPVVKNLLSRPDWDGVHVLRSLVQVPVFLADGTLVTTPGYHPNAKLWYNPPEGFAVTVPDEPTELDVAQAADLLLELLEDFPFSGEASRAHAIASILLPYLREMIEGPTPLHVFDAPIQGAGKGLLIEVGSIMSTGAEVGMVSVPEQDENELRKRITSKLLGGSQYIVLDNIVHPLRSAAVASALIARYWDDRILGLSESRRLKNQAIWMATGNNVELARDIARRAIFCRLEPLQEDPYLREGFKHPDLKAWVRSQRTELVSAALTIIKAWIVSGRPTSPHQMIGSFEAWADVLSGILGVAEIKGFLGNFKDTAGAVDPETEEWRAFVKAWWEKHQGQQVGVADLVELARNGIVRPGEGELLALGKAISKMKGRIIAGKRIDQGQRSNKIRSRWKLTEPPKDR